MSSTILVILGSDDVTGGGGGGVEEEASAAAVASHLDEPAKELKVRRTIERVRQHGIHYGLGRTGSTPPYSPIRGGVPRSGLAEHR